MNMFIYSTFSARVSFGNTKDQMLENLEMMLLSIKSSTELQLKGFQLNLLQMNWKVPGSKNPLGA